MDYRIIETGDGTISLYSNEYKEAMHSVSGAYEEALFKHVYPSGILENKKKNLNVLDIGFGLGYNILALLNELQKKRSGQFLTVVSLESDLSYSDLMGDISFGDGRDAIYKHIMYAVNNGEFKSERLSVKIIYGDARMSVKENDEIYFDAVFQDPYSPAKNPELWTVEFFKEIKRMLTSDAILTTYSSAPQVRGALMEAGYRIGIGPSVGKKMEGTLATVFGNIQLMSSDKIEILKRNIKSTPFRDCYLRDTRDSILNRRILEMREKKSINSNG